MVSCPLLAQDIVPPSDSGNSGDAVLEASPMTEVDLGTGPPPATLSPSLQLLREQISELLQASEHEEAIANLERLYDQGARYLVARGPQQHAGTLSVQTYWPVRSWCQTYLQQIVQQHPEMGETYRQARMEAAEQAWQEVMRSKDPVAARLAAGRYGTTSRGGDFSLLLADLYLERGWALAAVQVLVEFCPELRIAIEDGSGGSLPLSLTLRGEPAEALKLKTWLADRLQSRSPQERKVVKQRLVESLARVVQAAAIEPKLVDQSHWRFYWDSIEGMLPETAQHANDWYFQLGKEVVAAGANDSAEWSSFAGNSRRSLVGDSTYALDRWPLWSQTVPLYMGTSDQTPASKPRAGEVEQGTLPYHPVVADGKVYINTMTQVVAYNMSDGKAWPDAQSGKPLYDSHIAPSAFLPLGYPMVGVSRGTLTVSDGKLYARMGEPVTGWANPRQSLDGGSVGYLVGLDLERQGAMLDGFPIHLREPEFEGAEFEGAPVVFGNLLLVAIVERDNVGVRRSVAAFHRATGRLAWHSAVLASGLPAGSQRANLISHQLLSVLGGRVFYNTNLGAVACLDPMNGEVLWLTQYARDPVASEAYPQPDRFRYRDLTPPLVDRELVFCAPQDCAELFALDASRGDLVWSTSAEQVPDAVHLLGVVGDSLIVSGDRIAWVNRFSGKLEARFPGSNTPGVVNALPSPRGLGRGLISGSEVYWPTAGEVFVFSTDLPTRPGMPELPLDLSPVTKRRIRLGARGREGGNLVAAGAKLIYASPARIMVFD